MRTLRLIALIAATLAFLVPGLAFAASPPRLEGAISDQVGVLGGRIGVVQTALDDLLRDQDVQLFVLFVETTSDLTVTEFADETARLNSLGANDALLVVAVADRTDAIWVSDGLPDITDQELDAIIADAVEPALRSGDFPAAAIGAARELGDAAGPTPVVTPVATPGATPAPEAGGGGTINLGPILGLALVAAGGVLVVVWLISRLSRRRAAEELDRQTGKLAREANSLLVTTDERTRTAGQEADFVEA
ncbi:MAG TPA: TPM domain-containing protein, partial [Candidatus Limnocylindrales bacterium]|nr:TPM domain-containing protein [Candidatus Limnocylindrales bacterium]